MKPSAAISTPTSATESGVTIRRRWSRRQRALVGVVDGFPVVLVGVVELEEAVVAVGHGGLRVGIGHSNLRASIGRSAAARAAG